MVPPLAAPRRRGEMVPPLAAPRRRGRWCPHSRLLGCFAACGAAVSPTSRARRLRRLRARWGRLWTECDGDARADRGTTPHKRTSTWRRRCAKGGAPTTKMCVEVHETFSDLRAVDTVTLLFHSLGGPCHETTCVCPRVARCHRRPFVVERRTHARPQPIGNGRARRPGPDVRPRVHPRRRRVLRDALLLTAA